jgi:type I restriction enzyme, S subunit
VNADTNRLRFISFDGEWKKKQLSKLGEFKKTYSFSRSAEGKGEYHHIHYGDIHSTYKGIISDKTHIPTLSEVGPFECIQDGEIIFADASEDYNDLGKAVVIWGLNSKRVISGLHTHRFSPNKEINPLFLYYFTQTLQFRKFVKTNGTGISVLGISKNNLANLVVPLPNIEEQTKVAMFLYQFDQKIDKVVEKIEQLELFKKGLMNKIFSQEVRFKENGREFPEWKETTIGNISTTFSGGTPTSTNSSYYNGHIPFIRSGEIHSSATGLFISEEGLKNSSAKMVNKGDLLLALYGATSGEIGISKIDGAINQAILCIRTNQVKNYIKYYWENRKDVIINTYLQGGQGNLSASIVKDIIISLPTIKEQQKIADYLSKIDLKIEKEREKLQSLRHLKKGFLQSIFE